MESKSQFLAENLLPAIREGSKPAFEMFYRMEHDNLVHFVESYLKDRQQAEDIAQESLLKLWENRNGLDISGNIRAYVFTIARNATLDFMEKVRPSLSTQEYEALSDPGLENLIETLDLHNLVEKTWLALPAKLRDTFYKSRMQGLKNREIALEEGISVKTVEYRIGRALKIFKKTLIEA